MSASRRATIAWVVGALCASCLGCAREDSRATTSASVLRAHWVAKHGASPEPRVLHSWILSDEERPLVWRTLLAEPRIADSNVLGPGSRAVAFEGVSEARVVIKGDFEPLDCTHVRLRLITRAEVRCRAALVSANGDMRTKSSPVTVDTGARPDNVQIPLRVPDERERCNRIVLFFESDRLDLELGRVDVLAVSLAGELPDPEGPARSLEVGGDWRPSVGLSSARGLSASFEETTAASASAVELVWALAAVPKAREPDPLGPVHWRVRSGALQLGEGSLQLARSDPARWEEVRFPVGSLSAPLELELELTSLEQGREAVCAASEPRLERASSRSARTSRASTVLLITSDTHRADHLGAAPGARDLRTPNLDALAQRGVLFERCISATNVTNPSHVSLMTAVSPRDTLILGNTQPLSDAAPTLAEVFRDAGWLTFAVVSARHLDPEGSGLGQGFDRVSAPRASERAAGDTIAVARSWLRAAEGKPLFMWVHLFDAHTPYAPPAEFDRMYYGHERNPSDPERPALDARRDHGSWLPDPLTDLEYPLAQYRAEVTYLDAALAALLDEPRVADAIVAFVGDHGESLGEHDIYWDHAGLYAQTVHVPLMVAAPGLAPGGRVRGAVSALDVGRTLLNRAGLASGFPGRDLLADPGGASRDEPVFSVTGVERSASVTQGRWHLLLWLDSLRPRAAVNPRPRHAVELYDLDADPSCRNDVAELELATTVRLRRLLVSWLTSGGDTGWRQRARVGGERLEQLIQMGYLGGDGSPGGDWIASDCDCEQCARFRE